MQLNKQKISLGSASGSNFGVCTHFTPNVYEWFYDSLSTTATALNISISDLCYCCWCITMQNCMPNNAIDKMTAEDVSDILAGFEVEIKIQSQRIEQLLSNIKDGV